MMNQLAQLSALLPRKDDDTDRIDVRRFGWRYWSSLIFATVIVAVLAWPGFHVRTSRLTTLLYVLSVTNTLNGFMAFRMTLKAQGPIDRNELRGNFLAFLVAAGSVCAVMVRIIIGP